MTRISTIWQLGWLGALPYQTESYPQELGLFTRMFLKSVLGKTIE
jgi:hypothetical protein